MVSDERNWSYWGPWYRSTWWVAPFLLFSGLSLPLDSLITMCLGVYPVSEFILFEVRCASWTYRLMILIKIGMFSAIIFYKYSFYPLSCLFSFWNSHYMYVDMFDAIPQISGAGFIFLQSFPLVFFEVGHLNWPFFKSGCFLLPAQICCGAPAKNFSFQLLVFFSTVELLFDYFL